MWGQMRLELKIKGENERQLFASQTEKQITSKQKCKHNYVHPLTHNVQVAIKSAIETKHIIHVVCFYGECISE